MSTKINLEHPFLEWKQGYCLTTTKDQRKTVVLVNEGKTTSLQYARYLMSVKLGRKLHSDEYVIHIDRDVRNDSLDNLKVVSRDEHLRRTPVGVLFLQEHPTVTCPICEQVFTRSAAYYGTLKNREAFLNNTICCGISCARALKKRQRAEDTPPVPKINKRQVCPICETKFSVPPYIRNDPALREALITNQYRCSAKCNGAVKNEDGTIVWPITIHEKFEGIKYHNAPAPSHINIKCPICENKVTHSYRFRYPNTKRNKLVIDAQQIPCSSACRTELSRRRRHKTNQ